MTTFNVRVENVSVQELVSRFGKDLFPEKDWIEGPFAIWTKPKFCSLIESVLLGLPVPAIVMTQNYLLDGTNRLVALVSFWKGKFALKYLDIADEYEGKKFQQLEEDQQRRFLESQIPVIRVDGDNMDTETFNSICRRYVGGNPWKKDMIEEWIDDLCNRDVPNIKGTDTDRPNPWATTKPAKTAKAAKAAKKPKQ